MASEKIAMTIEDVKACEAMGLGQQDAYCDMLLATGKAANGSTDKVRDMAAAIESIAICMTRDAMHRIPDLKNAIEEVITKVVTKALVAHAKECPLADEIPNIVMEAMRAEAMKDDGSVPGQAMVSGHGIKAKADPWTTRTVAIAAVACFWLASVIVKTIMKGA